MVGIALPISLIAACGVLQGRGAFDPDLMGTIVIIAGFWCIAGIIVTGVWIIRDAIRRDA